LSVLEPSVKQSSPPFLLGWNPSSQSLLSWNIKVKCLVYACLGIILSVPIYRIVSFFMLSHASICLYPSDLVFHCPLKPTL
jgi:hypothetical protein